MVCFLYDLAGTSNSPRACRVSDNSSRARRKWADLVAIIASLAALGNAMWGPLIFGTISAQTTTDRGAGYNWFAFGVGGMLGLLGLILAQKRPALGRVPLAVGGALLVIVPFFYSHKAMLPIATSVVLGLLMIASAFFLGPMPAPRHVAEQPSRR
jgi:MFS family permease